MLDEGKAAKAARRHERYLRRRTRAVRLGQWFHHRLDRANGLSVVLRDTARGALAGFSLLVVAEVIAWLLLVTGASPWLAQRVPAWSTLDGSALGSISRIEMVGIVVGIAGFLLPLYFTVFGSIAVKYRDAPERVWHLVLADPVAAAYRQTLLGMGVSGLLILLLATFGWAPSGLTLVVVAGMAIVAFVGFLGVWLRMIDQAATPAAVLPLSFRRIKHSLKRARHEFEGKNDREAIAAFRKDLGLELATLTDLGTFAMEFPGNRSRGAEQQAIAVAAISKEYGALASIIPRGTEWDLPVLIHPDILASGGATDDVQEQSRVMPIPRKEGDARWVERRLANIATQPLLLALKGPADADIELVLDRLGKVLANLGAGGSIGGALAVHDALIAAYEARRAKDELPEPVDLVVYDRLGANLAHLIDAIKRASPRGDALQQFGEALHRAKDRAKGLSIAAGPTLKAVIEEIRDELDLEFSIEETLITPVQATLKRLQAAAQEDGRKEVLELVDCMRGFYVGLGNRLAASGAHRLQLAGSVQSWHMIRRIERRFGRPVEKLHPLDRERFEVPEGELRDALGALRSETLVNAAENLQHEVTQTAAPTDLPDIVGTAYYYSAGEAGVRAAAGPWNEAAEWLRGYLLATRSMVGRLLERESRLPAIVSPLQEAARVSGLLLLWGRVYARPHDESVMGIWQELLASWAEDAGQGIEELATSIINMASKPDWFGRPRYAQRFNATLAAWDRLCDHGLSRPVGVEDGQPTDLARELGYPLAAAASADHDVIHQMDAFFWALLAEEMGLDMDALDASVREAHQELVEARDGEDA